MIFRRRMELPLLWSIYSRKLPVCLLDPLFAVLVLTCFHLHGIFLNVFFFKPSRIFADTNPNGWIPRSFHQRCFAEFQPGRVVGIVPQAIAQDNLNDVISNIAALWAPEAVVF